MSPIDRAYIMNNFNILIARYELFHLLLKKSVDKLLGHVILSITHHLM